jgi:hypothetical protein
LLFARMVAVNHLAHLFDRDARNSTYLFTFLPCIIYYKNRLKYECPIILLFPLFDTHPVGVA